jgi:hypothetical protein
VILRTAASWRYPVLAAWQKPGALPLVLLHLIGALH